MENNENNIGKNLRTGTKVKIPKSLRSRLCSTELILISTQGNEYTFISKGQNNQIAKYKGNIEIRGKGVELSPGQNYEFCIRSVKPEEYQRMIEVIKKFNGETK